MASWSRKRKTLYAALAAVAIVGGAAVPAFLALYKPPSCFDGVKNGDEQGVDCGGSCTKLCASSYLPPSVSWARFEQVAPGLYNLGAYVINPNTDVTATAVPYHMSLYDDAGIPITDVYGTMTLPPHRNALAFKGAVSVGKRIPGRLLFEFTAAPEWATSSDPLAALDVTDKKYSETPSGSSLMVTFANRGTTPLDNISVSAILSDKDGNVVDFSTTVVDQVPAGGTAIAPFTWPVSHDGKVISIDVLPVAQ
ncbi:MAG: hypothetical protein KGI69_04130 [Patescibacteria group bacterium]|nr:hypothetical protein [Patescibacteria group bacterium]